MKGMKKLLAVVAALAVTLLMAVPAIPAGQAYAATGDITVNGATKDATYSAYKIFDVEYSGTNNENVTYVIPTGSTISSLTDFTTYFDTHTNGGKTYVTKKSGTNDADVIQWLKTNESSIATGTAAATVTNSDGAVSITLATGAAGYYYIKASVGTDNAVTIDTAHPTATVNSKLVSLPNIPNDGKTITTTSGDVSATTLNVGETASFKLKFNASNYPVNESGDNSTTEITSYTVTDTMSGLTYDSAAANLTVKVGDTTLTTSSGDSAYYTQSYDSTTHVLTVTINDYNKGNNGTKFTQPSEVTITYSATVAKTSGGDSSNSFKLKYNTTEVSGPDPEVHVYNYTVNIDKYASGAESTKLSGAKFVLKDGNTSSAKYYKVDSSTGAVSWVDNQSDATEVTTNDSGAATFAGLSAGTYYLVETEAPAGYSLLTDPQTVTLSPITQKLTESTTLTQTAEVANTASSGTMPSTGDMGTMFLYIAGIIAILAGCGYLIARRRMQR